MEAGGNRSVESALQVADFTSSAGSAGKQPARRSPTVSDLPHNVQPLMQSLKRFTAREGNRGLGLTGQSFWQDES
jgi:hypothetical protein